MEQQVQNGEENGKILAQIGPNELGTNLVISQEIMRMEYFGWTFTISFNSTAIYTCVEYSKNKMGGINRNKRGSGRAELQKVYQVKRILTQN